MRKTSKIIFLFVLAIIAGCAAQSARHLNNISVGMTKSQVIDELGPPDSIAANEGVEYMKYRLATSLLDFDGSDTSDYFVRLVDGRVNAYGQTGDFDTTATPKKRYEIEVK